MKTPSNTLRKAAVLMASLEPASAATMLAEMSESQAAALREAIEQLGEIDPAEQEAVIEEFFRIGPLVPAQQPAGIELDSRLAERIGRTSRKQYTPIEPTRPRSIGSQPFQCLHDAGGASVAARLQHEHPQTIAVVVSHLPPETAAELLASLPSDLQVDVAQRLIDLDETEPEILYEIERGLESWLSEIERSSRRRTAGMAALQNILAAADSDVHERVIANLERHDRRLASQLRPAYQRSFSFADLHDIDDDALRNLFAQAHLETLTLALAGASRSLVSRAYRLLPTARSARLRRELNQLGPMRVGDVENAQQQLADLAATLEARGQLSSSTGRKLSVAI